MSRPFEYYQSELTMPYDLGQSLISFIHRSSDYPSLLTNLAHQLGNVFLADVCLIIAGSRQEDHAPMAYWNGRQSTFIGDRRVKSFFFPSLWQSLETQITPIIDQWHRDETGEIPALASSMVIGTRFRGNFNGLIVLGSLTPRRWTSPEKTLLEEVAPIVAITYFLIQQEQRDFSPNPSVLPSFLRTWYDATRQRLEQQQQLNEQLSEQLNHLIQDIITIMSDQTRNPLATMKMALKMLRTSQLPSDAQKRLDMLEDAWGKLNDINVKILKFRELKSKTLQFSPQDFSVLQLLEEVAQPFQEKWTQDERKSLTLTVENNLPFPLIINSDPDHFTQIFTELLTNAYKFSLPNTTVLIQIREESNNSISITVTNQSQSLPQDHLKFFFDPFYREQYVIDNGLPGIGLGLTMVKELVQLLQGEIQINTMPTNSSESCMIGFEVILPLSPPSK